MILITFSLIYQNCSSLKLILICLLISISGQEIYCQATEDSVDNSSAKIWGYAFGDFFYKTGGDSLITALEYSKFKKNDNSFVFRRIFFGYDHFIGKSFETKLVLAYEGSDPASNASRTIIVKDAYLKWKNILPKLNFLFGIMPTPAYNLTSEKIWGYRSIEKTIMDQRGILNSRDLGVMLTGSLDKNNNIIYNIMAGNGSGGILENSRHKFYGTLIFHFFKKKLVASMYSDYETFGSEKYKNTYQVFIGYQSETLTIGTEAFIQHQNNFNINSNTIRDIIPFGISGFINVLLRDRLKFFARYDYWDPNTETPVGFNQHFIALGLDYMPHPDIHIMPNLWLNAYQSENPARKTDVVPRLTFFYKYGSLL